MAGAIGYNMSPLRGFFLNTERGFGMEWRLTPPLGESLNDHRGTEFTGVERSLVPRIEN